MRIPLRLLLYNRASETGATRAASKHRTVQQYDLAAGNSGSVNPKNRVKTPSIYPLTSFLPLFPNTPSLSRCHRLHNQSRERHRSCRRCSDPRESRHVPCLAADIAASASDLRPIVLESRVKELTVFIRTTGGTGLQAYHREICSTIPSSMDLSPLFPRK